MIIEFAKLSLNKVKNVSLVVVALTFMFPYQANASVNVDFDNDARNEILVYQRVMQEKKRIEAEKLELQQNRYSLAYNSQNSTNSSYTPASASAKSMNVVATAYTSTPDQCWGDPFTTASGKRVYDGLIAANGLPFGTQVKFPELYGDKIFTVDDRMSSRYGLGRIDIWMSGPRSEALSFGRVSTTMEIIDA